MNAYRLDSSEKKREPIEFYFNNKKLSGYDGEPIAVSLLANGIQTIRTCEVTGEGRGVFCGIGHCYECRAEVDGVANVRTCLTPNHQGTKVISPRSFTIRETLNDDS
ncbi:(2Fe-2S)-binding protein [Alteribacillus iranensis]|uniref:Sarcosine oxidase subunit alpha n=1 Tax=Alteribacillus iranensis TaxID=930128 RepID=A0A1I2BJQ6_9BACI|nr:(2Fe-2S)-binding protein [Alteribacillus iranensis]SFE56422.1 sarcosine oxidase subunit alpha [Alteribacillus iranensis]